MKKIKCFIIRLLAKRFYPKMGSHGWQHIQDVLSRAVRIKGSPLTDSEYAAILFHDCSLKNGDRATHAEDSAAIAQRQLRWFFSEYELRLITDAIRCHRASYQGMRKTWIEDLVASADRNPPCLAAIAKRSYQYAREHGMDDGNALAHVVEHVREKYGRHGYAFTNMPAPYLATYGSELKRMWSQIDNLDSATVRQLISE